MARLRRNEVRSGRLAALLAGALIAAFSLGMFFWAWRSAEYRFGTHLKGIALAYSIYAGEHDGLFPKLDGEPGVLVGDRTSLTIPDGWFGDRTWTRGVVNRHRVRLTVNYVYLGRPVQRDADVVAWLEDYKEAVRGGDASTANAAWHMNETDLASTPLLIELPSKYPPRYGVCLPFVEVSLGQPEPGGLVAYADGRVEFIPYPGKWPMTETTISALRAASGLRRP